MSNSAQCLRKCIRLTEVSRPGNLLWRRVRAGEGFESEGKGKVRQSWFAAKSQRLRGNKNQVKLTVGDTNWPAAVGKMRCLSISRNE